MLLRIFVVFEVLDAVPVTTVPPVPALFPPVFEFEVVLLMIVPLLLIVTVTLQLPVLQPSHLHELPAFLHVKFVLSFFGTARNPMSTENESVCVSLPRNEPSHVIVAASTFTVRLPKHQEIPMYLV